MQRPLQAPAPSRPGTTQICTTATVRALPRRPLSGLAQLAQLATLERQIWVEVDDVSGNVVRYLDRQLRELAGWRVISWERPIDEVVVVDEDGIEVAA